MSENELDELYRDGLQRLSDTDLPWDKTPTWERLDQALEHRKRLRGIGIWWQMAAGFFLVIGIGWLVFRTTNQADPHPKTAFGRKLPAPISVKTNARKEEEANVMTRQVPKVLKPLIKKPYHQYAREKNRRSDAQKPVFAEAVETNPIPENQKADRLVGSVNELPLRSIPVTEFAPISRVIKTVETDKTMTEPAEDGILPRKKRFRLPIALVPNLIRPASLSTRPVYSYEKAPVQLQISL
ncbi:hypothetical protein GCM10028803_10100 [Larkinella knui]|uniref:Uncharacterized protein n=1 Tax=Larkinella knui TaxID=2025310 RepID=A0A3P1CD57_9BACT|nr:hypothetical protein [Larkinella knui]RRB11016.1 hypothetical protein EHT87_28155 [Larkinella knui]